MNAETLMTQEQKAKAYDMLTTQLNGLVQQFEGAFANLGGGLNMVGYGYLRGKADAAEAIRAALTHAQLVADEPPHSDDPEVETKRFETVEVGE